MTNINLFNTPILNTNLPFPLTVCKILPSLTHLAYVYISLSPTCIFPRKFFYLYFSRKNASSTISVVTNFLLPCIAINLYLSLLLKNYENTPSTLNTFNPPLPTVKIFLTCSVGFWVTCSGIKPKERCC